MLVLANTRVDLSLSWGLLYLCSLLFDDVYTTQKLRGQHVKRRADYKWPHSVIQIKFPKEIQTVVVQESF